MDFESMVLVDCRLFKVQQQIFHPHLGQEQV